MPDFDTRRPKEQNVPNEPRIGLVANKLRTALMATRLRALLIGGGILLLVVAVPVGLLFYSPSWLGEQQWEVVDKALNDDNPLSACAADRGSQRPFVLSDQNDIWTMSLDGSDLRSITSTDTASVTGEPVLDSQPAWAPDRKRIAFTRSHSDPASGSASPEEHYSIYVMNHDGSCQTKLLDADATGPTWSPDGKKIAFSKTRPGYLNSIYLMNADGSGITKRLTTEHSVRDTNPAWSPDGKKIAFERNDDIYIIDCCEDEEGNTNQAKLLTNGPGWDRDPVWSPDGSEIAFTHIDVGEEHWGEVIRNTDVYKMDADGSRETRLTHTYSSKHPEHDAVWSPTGNHLAFMKGYYSGTNSVSSNTLYLMNPDGSDPILVKRVPESYEMDLDWK